jgi:putative ABC transport system permease protein
VAVKEDLSHAGDGVQGGDVGRVPRGCARQGGRTPGRSRQGTFSGGSQATRVRSGFFVANASYVAQATGNPAVGAFLVDTGGTGQPAVAHRLRALLGTSVTVTDVTRTRATVGSSLTAVDLAGLTLVELAFAILLAAGAAVLALGIAERRRTFAIGAVLGATRTQLRGMVLSEAGAVTVAGIAAGALTAWALSVMPVKVLTGVFDPPPSTIPVPWGYIVAAVTVTAAAIAAAALGAARQTRRPPVEELRDL